MLRCSCCMAAERGRSNEPVRLLEAFTLELSDEGPNGLEVLDDGP
jgi:hypothetical protein